MSFLRKAVMLLNREFPTETLIKRGMRVGKDFNRQQGCFLDPTHCFLITIGDDVTMSIRVTVMAHDASTKKMLGYTKIGQVHVRKIRLGMHIGWDMVWMKPRKRRFLPQQMARLPLLSEQKVQLWQRKSRSPFSHQPITEPIFCRSVMRACAIRPARTLNG